MTIRLPFVGRPPVVPDPGQYSWRQGFRAISCPLTAESGEVVVWVATEDEYRAARHAERDAVGVPWPSDRMLVSDELPWRVSREER